MFFRMGNVTIKEQFFEPIITGILAEEKYHDLQALPLVCDKLSRINNQMFIVCFV